MPKSYSDQEREYIRKRLKEEAAKCLAQYGVRRTTVDEIVKRVNIPKGTFYLFYKSKELLLFEVIQEQHEIVSRELYQAISGIAGTEFSAEKLTDVIFRFYKMTEKMLVLRLLDLGEVELLVRKLPRETVEEHLQDDTDMIEKMFSVLPVKKEVDIKVISAAFHAIYYATLHKAEIGEEQYDEALRALIYGIVSQVV
ncbi:TetR/AcrR family transcriptional regulator [Cuneatibacter caecimuris]|uniref:TetR family transcriptional regulator n=1 Tax=Cuneatibacter caecimuris TaxID=1796618 RepID=A0A4Q7PP91_9FIRM|nr:TetR/AcrR family transcriptional regulator [Cuneatibacter caecimuris]RZT02096.1 TetR family transcriptional regulator [Cuneatibacter caecimuris]